jgi:GDP/UDP-N,N'-diacetylbacillosamine 2-epimerase (hydrolysing)
MFKPSLACWEHLVVGTFGIMLKKIIYVSGTRADYGLMRYVLKKLAHSPEFDLSLCVTGMHLSSLYGNTVQDIEADGFQICARIPVDVDKTTHESMALSIGHEILGMTEVFAREKPDMILLLGDRGESLAAALVAVHLNIPIVHLHGGERSGTVDEMVRHAISKLAHYHFVATQASRKRLIQMGEREDCIFVVGAPGLEEIIEQPRGTKASFYEQFAFDPEKKTALCLYHPVVQEYHTIQAQFLELMRAALDLDLQLICLEPNADAGGALIREALLDYTLNPQVRIFKHLPRDTFIHCLAQVDVMLGNSSSGIIEAASFDLPVVNVGMRQQLRERSANVIDVSADYDSVLSGLKQALAIQQPSYENCYGDGKSSERCYHLLKTIDLGPDVLNKCNSY